MVPPFSVLDLAPIPQGSTASDAFERTVEVARLAERLGYRRYWLAEHHNLPGIASAATAIVISRVASATTRIRVGSGGIMLPNHSPLVIAEQFGTLESLFPGRIDLGLGRAPGTDPMTARALRRGLKADAERFPSDVAEIQTYFEPAVEGQAVQAVPGAGLRVPIWILGSSLFGAQTAALMGLPFAFASHFAPHSLMEALELYRSQFVPSAQCARPYAMAAIGVYAADSDREAARLFTSQQQAFLNLRRGRPGLLPAPVDTMEGLWEDYEERAIGDAFREAVVGSPATVRRGIEAFIDRTGVDELMVAAAIHDQGARLRSFEIVAQCRREMEAAGSQAAPAGARR